VYNFLKTERCNSKTICLQVATSLQHQVQVVDIRECFRGNKWGLGGRGHGLHGRLQWLQSIILFKFFLFKPYARTHTLSQNLSHTPLFYTYWGNGRAHTHMPTVKKPTNLHTLYSYKTSLLLHGTLQILQIRANIYQTLNLKNYPVLQHLQPYNTNCYHTLWAPYTDCSNIVQYDRVCRQNIVRYNWFPICQVDFVSLLKMTRAHTPPTNCILGRLHN